MRSYSTFEISKILTATSTPDFKHLPFETQAYAPLPTIECKLYFFFIWWRMALLMPNLSFLSTAPSMVLYFKVILPFLFEVKVLLFFGYEILTGLEQVLKV